MDLNLWKSKDDLKKFIENLGTEYRYGCFEENNPQTCHLLGDYLLSIDKAASKAAQIYKSNCDENKFGLSCDAYGRMAYRGQGMAEPSTMLAFEYFVKGCDQNEPRSCYHGGQMLGINDKHVNRVITPDPDRSIEMLKKACHSGKQPAACVLIHSFGLKGCHGRPADLKLAAEYAKTACDQYEPTGCFNLSRMYHLGEGVEADMEKSSYYKKRFEDITKNLRKGVTTISVDGSPDNIGK